MYKLFALIAFNYKNKLFAHYRTRVYTKKRTSCERVYLKESAQIFRVFMKLTVSLSVQ